MVAGTEPAGLNQLFSLLRSHPDLWLPARPQPEPNFFSKDLEYERGTSHYHQTYFSEAPAELLCGEKSGRYLWHPAAAHRIHQYNPRMKLLFILRDPVDRAYSNYRFNCLNGLETLSFPAALAREEERTQEMSGDSKWKDIQPFAYRDKGFYGEQLARYRELFPEDQILVLRNTILGQETAATMARVFRFLEVEHEDWLVPSGTPSYPSYGVRFRPLQGFLRRHFPRLLEAAIMALREGRKPTLAEWIVQRNLSLKRVPLNGEVRRALGYQFRNDLEKLAPFLDFEIEDWVQS